MPFNEDGTRKTMAYKKGPFIMKGSPMQRNFGIGPLTEEESKAKEESKTNIPFIPKKKKTIEKATPKTRQNGGDTKGHETRHSTKEKVYQGGELPEVTVTADKPITRGDVVQTLVSPHTDIKKSSKVVKHYGKKAKGKIKKVKEWFNKPVS